MEHHLGRTIDHVGVQVSDLEASRRFYQAALRALGRDITDGDGYFNADEFFVSADREPTRGLHLAFQAADHKAVARFHQAAIAAGGRDHGGPGERHYHPGYYAAFVLDPDGNNVEAVHHGPVRRSAASVVVTEQDEP